MFYDYLKQACKEKGTSITAVLKKIGVGTANGTYWKNGSVPSSDIVIQLSEFLGVSTDYLLKGKESDVKQFKCSSKEQEVLNIYNQLSEISKERVLERARVLLELETEQKSEAKSKTITILSSEYRVSAGRGIMLDEEGLTEITVPDTPEARRADFALTICGDSMEPIYHDGDVVLVRKMPSLEVGEIGIFYVDGSGYIKKYGGDRLISLNSAYDDILLDENTRCFGKVIGRV
ncbi:MAG: hypothetical protein IJ496_09440 [Ruminococcus sp.]|nr:hypothetical protein [Ruminococcus sp.]